jgi:hypothetical protein
VFANAKSCSETNTGLPQSGTGSGSKNNTAPAHHLADFAMMPYPKAVHRPGSPILAGQILALLALVRFYLALLFVIGTTRLRR